MFTRLNTQEHKENLFYLSLIKGKQVNRPLTWLEAVMVVDQILDTFTAELRTGATCCRSSAGSLVSAGIFSFLILV